MAFQTGSREGLAFCFVEETQRHSRPFSTGPSPVMMWLFLTVACAVLLVCWKALQLWLHARRPGVVLGRDKGFQCESGAAGEPGERTTRQQSERRMADYATELLKRQLHGEWGWRTRHLSHSS